MKQMTLKDVEEFLHDTEGLIKDNNEMIRRLQTANQYIPTDDISDLLKHNLKQLNIYYSYLLIDLAIEKARSDKNYGT